MPGCPTACSVQYAECKFSNVSSLYVHEAIGPTNFKLQFAGGTVYKKKNILNKKLNEHKTNFGKFNANYWAGGGVEIL